MSDNQKGLFVISLDFELFWGIRDKYDFDTYGQNVIGVWEVIPQMLELFDKYGIHATFATVGCMFSENYEDLKNYIPEQKPAYTDKNLSPYNGYIDDSVHHDPKYYFGKKLLQLVKEKRQHEIGSHTFSHYYGLEPGQTKDQFEADIDAAVNIAKSNGIELETLVFPRHQINPEYLKILRSKGIGIYRETEKSWFHSAQRGAEESILKRGFRFLDYFVWMGSHHCQNLGELKKGELYAVRAGRWLRPYKKSESSFDFLKIRRIKKQLDYAAKNGKIFHLWFHPHDIGINREINFRMLEEILNHYKKLNRKYGIQSMNMKEVVELYKQKYES